MKIPFFVQEFTKEMEEAAIHALRNESFVGGESVEKFEEEFARYIGTKYAASVSSGNGALQISLMALGIGESHKVITPTHLITSISIKNHLTISIFFNIF